MSDGIVSFAEHSEQAKDGRDLAHALVDGDSSTLGEIIWGRYTEPNDLAALLRIAAAYLDKGE